MGDPAEDLDALLSGPPGRWKTIKGRFRTRHNEPLLDYGRGLHRGRSGEGLRHEGVPFDDETWDEEKDEFWAEPNPFRLRVEKRIDTTIDPSQFSTLLINHTTWWEFGHGPCITNAGDETYKPGAQELRTQLFPGGLDRGLRPEDISRSEIEGRPVIAVHAMPIQALIWELGELAVLGSDGYLMEVDLATGVLLRWSASIEGQPARQGELTGLEVDGHVDPGLFLPPQGESCLPPAEWPPGVLE